MIATMIAIINDRCRGILQFIVSIFFTCFINYFLAKSITDAKMSAAPPKSQPVNGTANNKTEKTMAAKGSTEASTPASPGCK